MTYNTDDWITYRTKQGWTATGVIIATSPNGTVTVGKHTKDPDAKTINKQNIINTIDVNQTPIRYEEGDTVSYNHPQGWSEEGTILAIRPDNKLIIGSHPHDADASTIQQNDIIRKIKN